MARLIGETGSAEADAGLDETRLIRTEAAAARKSNRRSTSRIWTIRLFRRN